MSKNARARLLHHHNFRMDCPAAFWQIVNTGIALCTKGIDVDLIILRKSHSCEPLAHIPILDVREHTLEDAIVHPMPDGLQKFHYLLTSLGVADVVCDDIEMLFLHTS